MKQILIIDNNDSFVYNIVEVLRTLGVKFRVRNEADRSPIEFAGYDGIILSPGPGLPVEHGLMSEILECHAMNIPILGICLGHQAIAERFGCRLLQLERPLHGHTSQLIITKPCDTIFRNIESPIAIGRYHSWVVDPLSVDDQLEVLAVDEDENIMALRHCLLPIYGLQFHPESIITVQGVDMIANWITSL